MIFEQIALRVHLTNYGQKNFGNKRLISTLSWQAAEIHLFFCFFWIFHVFLRK
jgi:hypothetical protein